MGLKVATWYGLKVTYQIGNSYNNGDKQTNMETIRCGVRQGSILGPLLFLIFVNDHHKMKKYFDPIMFADNRNLFYSHKNTKTLFQMVNSELKLVNEWFLANKLSLNAKKKQNILYFINC